MQVKILHTGDVHLGMAFSRFPEAVQNVLTLARIDTLARMVEEANRQSCELIVIAGDLFHQINPPAQLRWQAVDLLNRFSGKAIAILPGNNDYDDGINDLWPAMSRDIPDRLLVLNETRVYSLDAFGLEIDLYPAPCRSRRQIFNEIGWMAGSDTGSQRLKLGVAHGAVEDISAARQGECFYMSRADLEAQPVDLWLLGHTHNRYPDLDRTDNLRLLICGTPQPDNFGCSPGNAWIITVDDKTIAAEAFNPEIYRFINIKADISSAADLAEIEAELVNSSDTTLIYLSLNGSLPPEDWDQLPQFLQSLTEKFLSLEVENNIELMLTQQDIDQLYTHKSFPHSLLTNLLEQRSALPIAYELIGRAKR